MGPASSGTRGTGALLAALFGLPTFPPVRQRHVDESLVQITAVAPLISVAGSCQMASITPVPTIIKSAPIVAALNQVSTPASIERVRHAVLKPANRRAPMIMEVKAVARIDNLSEERACRPAADLGLTLGRCGARLRNKAPVQARVAAQRRPRFS